MSKKTHWKKTYHKDYLGSHDLDNGEGGTLDLKVTISHIEQRTIVGEGGRESDANVAFFTDKGVKPYILNVEANERIAAFSGSKYIEDFAGCEIQLWVQPDAKLMSGAKGEAVRIRAQQPRTEFPVLDKDHARFAEICQKYADKGDSVLTAARKGFTISDETEELIKSRAADLREPM